MRCQAWDIGVAQRQVASMRNRTLPGASGNAGSDVQYPVAEGRDLAGREFGMVGEPEELGPGDEIGGGQDDFEPGSVGVEGLTVGGPGRSL